MSLTQAQIEADVQANMDKFFHDKKIKLSKKAMPEVEKFVRTVIVQNYKLEMVKKALSIANENVKKAGEKTEVKKEKESIKEVKAKSDKEVKDESKQSKD